MTSAIIDGRDGISVDSVQNSPLDAPQHILPDDEEIDIAAIFQRTITEPTAIHVKAFVRKAAAITLELPELEKYLTTLERGHIVSSDSKFKILLLHAANLENIEQAEHYKKEGAIDCKQLVLELLPTENATKPAIQFLTQEGLSLHKSEVTLPILQSLLLFEVDANKISIDNKSLLSWALQTENDALIELAIRSKARFCENLFQDHAAMLFFSKRLEIPPEIVTSVQVLQELKKMGVDLKPALAAIISYAAASEDIDILAFLHHEGLDTNAPFEDKNTPLHIALEKSHAKFARALLANGASLFVPNGSGVTPFQLLLNNNYPEMQALLLEPTLYADSLPIAYLNQSLQGVSVKDTGKIARVLEMLVEKFSLETFYTTDGMEFFGLLFRFAAREAVKIVMEKGYNLRAKQSHGHSPFSKLIEQKNALAIAHLIGMGYLTQEMTTDEGLPLLFWIAAQRAPGQPLKVAAKNGLNTTLLGSDGETVLHQATKSQILPNVTFLIDSQLVDVNALDQHGRPALYYALTKGSNPEIVSALIVSGAHPFHLGERLLQYTNYIFNDHFTQVIGTTQVWKMFTDSSQNNFATFMRSLSFHTALPAIQQEALECALLIPQLLPQQSRLFLNKESCFSALLQLRKKFPQAPLEHFFPLLTVLEQSHLQRPIPDTNLPKHNLEEKFDLELAQFRESIVKRLGDSSVSAHSRFDFQHEYNVHTLIPLAAKFLKKELETHKEGVVNWFTANMPESYDSPTSLETSWAIAALDLFIKRAEDKKEILQQLLFRVGITISKEDTPESALKKLRQTEFISSFVFERGNKTLTPEALLFFLEKRSILREQLPGLFAEFIKEIL